MHVRTAIPFSGLVGREGEGGRDVMYIGCIHVMVSAISCEKASLVKGRTIGSCKPHLQEAAREHGYNKQLWNTCVAMSHVNKSPTVMSSHLVAIPLEISLRQFIHSSPYAGG